MAKITNISTLTSNYTLPDDTTRAYQVESNESTTENMTTSFLKEKSTAREYAVVTDEILQTLKLTNNSEYQIKNIKVQDTISEGGSFKADSLTINGVTKTGEDITQGVTLENPLDPSESVTITYLLVITDNVSGDVINNVSQISYTVNEDLDFAEQTEVVSIMLETNIIEIRQTSSKSAVIKGDTLTFQNVITNKGLLVNSDVFFKNELPTETEFVTGSVKINNVVDPSLDPTVGFNIQNLNPNDEVTITFDVEVK